MKLGIDISQIIHEGTGVARFTAGLTNAILDFDKNNEWTFFFSSLRRKLNPDLDSKILEKGHQLIKWKLPPTILSFIGNDLHFLSRHLLTNNSQLNYLDWFITSDWTEPALKVKKATIVHDLAYLRYPKTIHPKILSTQKKRLHWIKKESNIIFSDSQATKQDLIDLLKFEPEKVCVNYPGVEVKKQSTEQINITLKKYNLNRSFILSVGKLEPRKNIPALMEAFSQLKNKNIDLVIVGPEGWETGFRSINRSKSLQDNENIKLLGYLPDIELFALYSSCRMFILPSLWEGFGYPIIEAMKLGAPVAVSNNSSLKEIAGDAAVFFDPESISGIADSINKLAKDENLRQTLRKKGLDRSKIFTWLDYYKRMINTLQSY